MQRAPRGGRRAGAAARPSAGRTPDGARPKRAESRHGARHRGGPGPTAGTDPPVAPCAGSTSTGQSATPCRSTRPHTPPAVGPRRPPSPRSAVELRLCEKRGGLPQDLIRTLQFADFARQLFQALALVGRQAAAHARIALGLPHSLPQRFGRAAQLARDRRDRGPLRRVLGSVLADHPNGPLSYLGGISTRSCHGLHPLKK